MDDFFAELEADIAKHLAADKLKRDRDNAKKRANTTSLPSGVRAAASAEYKQLNELLAAQEWKAISTVAVFTEQTCDGCGSTHRIFLQFMEHQSMVRQATNQRWVRVTKPRPESELPRESLLQPITTHICSHCCEDHGFGLIQASRLAPRAEAVVPSFTYQQDDINAPSF